MENRNLRSAFYADTHTKHNGKSFQIVGMRFEDVGGDHPEPIFTVLFNGGEIANYVNAECIFTGHDENFDKWVAEKY